jgi:hypothetical protein
VATSPTERAALSDAARLRADDDPRLDDMLRDQLRLIRTCQDALATEMTEALGGAPRALTSGLADKLKALTAALNTATDAQVRLDKTAADRAKRMSPADWLAAIRAYVLAMPHADRAALLQDLTAAHHEGHP